LYVLRTCNHATELLPSFSPVETLFRDLDNVTSRSGDNRPVTQLKTIKSNAIGKYVSIRGTVVRVGNVKPLVTQMKFQCARCRDHQTLPLPDGKFYPPTQCPTDECRSKSFEPVRGDEETETIDFQKIRIQEINETR
jgi:DNA helicase MCM8